MKDITYYFSDLPSNNTRISSMLNEIKANHAKIDDNNIVENKKLKMRKKHKDTFLNKNEQIKQDRSKKLIETKNNKRQLKRKIIEIIKIDNKLKKKKTQNSTIESNKNLEMIQIEKNNSPKSNDLNSSKYSDNLLTYFSKANSEDLEKQKFIKTKVTIKAEIHKFQNSLQSTTYDTKKNYIPESKHISNLKELQYEFDEIYLMESEIEKKALSPENDKLTSLMEQNKQKWSLKIQLQSNKLDASGKVDHGNIHTTMKSLKLKNENMKNCSKIPKILLPIKNKKDISASDYHSSKIQKDEKKKLKIVLEENCNINNVCAAGKYKYKTNTSNLKQQNIHVECEIINENYFKLEQKEKLAPLFTKKIISCPQILPVDNLNLQSNIYNNIFNDTQQIKPVESIILPFPRISHVTQLPFENHVFDETCNLSLKKNENFQQSFNFLQVKDVLKLNDIIETPECIYECVKSDVKTALFEIKSYCSDVQDLWKFVSKFKQSKNSQNPPLKIRRKISNKKSFKCSSRNDFQNELLHCLWTDKYKPKCSTDLVGNEKAVEKLKSWLINWNIKNNEDYSSSEEFYSSELNAINYVETNQVAVLIGPHGSGKTASVYAIANELGYKVLEVNASSKRTGKKILKDFEEASKSHRVKKLNSKHIFSSKSNNPEQSKNCQKSLILMEDVDLVFEEDDGFVSAVFYLATNTKRPIVMTLTNSCSHLCKMASNQLRINFKPVCGERLLALLQLIILSEIGCKLSTNCLSILCESGDLRKCLLQLQYLLLSGKKYIPFTSLDVNNSLWNNMQIHIYKSSMKMDYNKKKKILKNKNLNTTLDNLVNYLDSFTLMSNINDPSSHLLDLKFEPSISLMEDPRFYSSLDNLSLEIGNWLNDKIKSISNDVKISNNLIDKNGYQLLIKKQMHDNINTVLSQIASITLDRQALAIDYVSNIRTICRAEEIRNQFTSKRGNRFFHYLQNFRFIIETTKLNSILSAACKILQKTTTISSIND